MNEIEAQPLPEVGAESAAVFQLPSIGQLTENLPPVAGNPPPGPEPYLDKQTVAQLLGVKLRTLESYMARQLVPFIVIGGRTVRFRWSQVQAWLEANNGQGSLAHSGGGR